MTTLPQSIQEFVTQHPRIAIYGAGGMGRGLVTTLAQHRPEVTVVCLLDSNMDAPASTPPVVRVDDLSKLTGRIDGIMMATAYNREILAAHGHLLRAFPLIFADASGVTLPYLEAETVSGFLHLDERALGCWDQLWHGYDREAEAKDQLLRLLSHTMVTFDGLMTLVELVRHVDAAKIPGTMVECGSWRGGASALMAVTHMEGTAPHRAMHIFDSFQGLPEPDGKADVLPQTLIPTAEQDTEFDGALRPIGSLEADRASNEEALFDIAGYPRELVSFHEGWFQDTIPGAEVGPIAVLRLDGDLYESYRVCLEHLYPLVSPGGIVILDDWCLPGCQQAVNEYFEHSQRPLLHRIDSISRYLVKV